jgi:NitT/TauT family transport system ATP-binding protein
VISLENVSYRFAGAGSRRSELPVLEGINLTIEDGSFVSILGPSGCGKTTLLRIIAGLIRLNTGRVLIDGKPLDGPSRERALVFQEFNLLPWRTVFANVEFGLEVQGVPAAERRARVKSALKLVALEGFEDRYPHELSGGMKQRTGLARALCTEPKYLLMDEPFGNLDPQIREIMQASLLELWELDRKTVVFVTHSIEEAIFLSDRVVVLTARPGRVLECVDIDLPRPRGLGDAGVRTTTRFMEHRSYLWKRLKPQLTP